MDKLHYEEMKASFEELVQEGSLSGKKIYLFGHCNATEELADLLLSGDYHPAAILDNNKNKHGRKYRGIGIVSPQRILKEAEGSTIVCIAARAYEAMSVQLRQMGYRGQIRKLVDYNSYAEYSVSSDSIARMKRREEQGEELLRSFAARHLGAYKILCPFSALGDIYMMMSYLQAFLEQRGIERCVIGVIGESCRQVVRMFGEYETERLEQKEMDRIIQAVLYTGDPESFIPHQDRPYVVNLFRALYIKKIPLEQIYCCGVFGLPRETRPASPVCFEPYPDLEQIPEGKAVILSPYAKSVTALADSLWKKIIYFYAEQGYECFTNVNGEEQPLAGTKPLRADILQIRSAVERAGTFVGIRSGLCDVLKEAKAKKIALYPDYYYCDTQWKAVDIYALDGWDNRVVKEDENGR